MKFNQKVISLCLVLLFCFFIANSMERIYGQLAQRECSSMSLSTRIPFSNIVINDDGDWATYGINGSGTLAEPYLIENLEIITGASYGIFIMNTAKAFLIKNCYVSSSIDGIYIHTTAEGSVRIEDCEVRNVGQNGIVAFETPGAIFIYNELSDGGTYGTALSHSGGNAFIAHNIVSDYHSGIATGGGNTEIYNNTVSSMTMSAIRAVNGDNYQIYNNTCTTSSHGIYVQDSSNTVVYNNTCSFNTGNGTRLDISYYCEIKYNWFIANDEFGVVLAYQSSNNIIHHNAFIGNAEGTGQAYVEGPTNASENNLWYDPVTLEGNYWSDWDGEGFYEIGGGTGEADPYPLSTFEDLPVIGEYQNRSIILLGITLFATSGIYLRRRKQK